MTSNINEIRPKSACWCEHIGEDHDERGVCKKCPPRVDGGATSEEHAAALNAKSTFPYASYEESWCMKYEEKNGPVV